MEHHPIVVFDGVCNLCSGFARFLVSHDRRATFRLAASQSPAGQALLAERGANAVADGSLILFDGDGTHTQSDAVLCVLSRLDGPWHMLAWLRVIPRPARDVAYRLIARYRYRVFGRRLECMAPTPEQRDRFL